MVKKILKELMHNNSEFEMSEFELSEFELSCNPSFIAQQLKTSIKYSTFYKMKNSNLTKSGDS